MESFENDVHYFELLKLCLGQRDYLFLYYTYIHTYSTCAF